MTTWKNSLAVMLLAAGTSLAGTISSQGFEADTGGWVASAGITRVASGGGTLGVASASGSFHAEIQNLHNGYQPGSGDGGYSFLGFTAPNAYQGDFYQSIAVYVDASWASHGSEGFWIDMSPTHPSGNWGAEHNFRLTSTGDAINIVVDNNQPLAVIGASGWYTFEMAFKKGLNPTDVVTTDLTVYDAGHTALGTITRDATSPGGPLLSSDLGGPGYVWLTVWDNGFANDVLAIDDVQSGFSGPVPEPATIGFAAVGLALLGWRARPKR